jgi:DNA (cytosine-5)-methyltransferase 1
MEALGYEVAWQAEVDAAASAVLAHHWPGVPNLGDLTETDWSKVESVDAIVGGFPCQPFSLAGKRKR